MNTYTIFNSQKIIMVLRATEDTLRLNLNEGETYLEGAFSDEFYYVKDNQIKQYPEKPDYPVTFDLEIEQWVSNQNAAWAILRYDRDSLLSQSDWTQSPDSPLSETKKAEWAQYRTLLRNLPASTSDPANPSWPDTPS